MNFVNTILRGISFIPATVQGIEGLFANKSGSDKKDAALSFVTAALNMSEAVSSREIVDQEKFRQGLGQVIDGVVQCMNASCWAKTAASTTK